MKKYLKFLLLNSFLILVLIGCGQNHSSKIDQSDTPDFTFVFLADIHLQPELDGSKAFDKVIHSVNKLNPDFVLTGGDMIMDALETPIERVNMLYDLYQKKIKDFNMKVYNTIGNHDIFGWYEKSKVDPSHKLYGKKMYEKRLGERYYSFDFKEWHFMVLDSIQRSDGNGYIGKIDDQQIEWIKNDLLSIGKEVPIVISTHIPFISVNYQLRKGALEPIRPSVIITNGKEVLDLFKEYSLKLVLQAHLHFYEEIRAKGVTYITGGAVSANWWKGPYYGLEEGFLLIKIKGETITPTYIDYGWEIKE